MLKSNPMKSDYPVLMQEIKTYYADLSYQVGKVYLESISQLDRRYKGEEREEKIKAYGEAIISPREYLNIPELIKRLITLKVVANRINNSINVQLTESQDYLRQAFENTDIDILKDSFQDINLIRQLYREYMQRTMVINLQSWIIFSWLVLFGVMKVKNKTFMCLLPLTVWLKMRKSRRLWF